MGINRISLGVQSFQNDKLKSLGRIHNDEQVYQAVDELYKSGLTNFNIDLMHGLPNQSKEDALFDLNEAIKLKPKHISWYQLTIEPNTPFAAKPPILPNDNILESIEISGKQLLEKNDFKQYEISAFAKEGFQAKHNLNYWRFGDYIGIGAGAHGKITYPDKNKIKRIWKIKHPKLYLQSKNYIADSQLIKPEERVYEFMLNTLRLKNGVEKELLNITTNIDFNSIENAYQKAINLGLLNNHKIQIKPTEKGFLFLNDLINLFAL